MVPKVTKDAVIFFSLTFKPGAMKPQIWYKIHGMEMNMDPIKETFMAVKNGSVGVIKVSSAYFLGNGSINHNIRKSMK